MYSKSNRQHKERKNMEKIDGSGSGDGSGDG